MGKKKDIRRWVIMTLRNGGASEEQFPLPITHNGHRVVFDRDVPVIVPFFYREQMYRVGLPRFEQVRAPAQEGAVRSLDDVQMKMVGYFIEVEEIPVEYQTIEGIEKLQTLLQKRETAPEGLEEFVGAKIGPRDTPPHSESWDRELRGIAPGVPEPPVEQPVQRKGGKQ